MKRFTVLFLALFLVLSVGAVFAGGEQEQPTQQMEAARPSGGYVYYVVTHGGPADPWWGGTFNNGIEAAKSYYTGTEIHWLGPEKYSVQQQVDMLNTALAAEPDGIVVTIPNARAFDKPLRRAIDMGIPVITVNVTDNRSALERIPYLCYIGGDEYQMGYQSGIRMMKAFNGKKPRRAVVLIHEVGHAGLELRAKGFADAMPGVTVDKLAGSPNQSENYQALDAYLTKNPDTDAVFCVGPLGAHPTLRLFEDKGYFGKIKLGSVDVSEIMLEAVKEGKMVFCADQQAWLQAFMPIGLLNLYNDFGLIPHETILTGPDIVDASNVDSVMDAVKQGLR